MTIPAHSQSSQSIEMPKKCQDKQTESGVCTNCFSNEASLNESDLEWLTAQSLKRALQLESIIQYYAPIVRSLRDKNKKVINSENLKKINKMHKNYDELLKISREAIAIEDKISHCTLSKKPCDVQSLYLELAQWQEQKMLLLKGSPILADSRFEEVVKNNKNLSADEFNNLLFSSLQQQVSYLIDIKNKDLSIKSYVKKSNNMVNAAVKDVLELPENIENDSNVSSLCRLIQLYNQQVSDGHQLKNTVEWALIAPSIFMGGAGLFLKIATRSLGGVRLIGWGLRNQKIMSTLLGVTVGSSAVQLNMQKMNISESENQCKNKDFSFFNRPSTKNYSASLDCYEKVASQKKWFKITAGAEVLLTTLGPGYFLGMYSKYKDVSKAGMTHLGKVSSYEQVNQISKNIDLKKLAPHQAGYTIHAGDKGTFLYVSPVKTQFATDPRVRNLMNQYLTSIQNRYGKTLRLTPKEVESLKSISSRYSYANRTTMIINTAPRDVHRIRGAVSFTVSSGAKEPLPIEKAIDSLISNGKKQGTWDLDKKTLMEIKSKIKPSNGNETVEFGRLIVNDKQDLKLGESLMAQARDIAFKNPRVETAVWYTDEKLLQNYYKRKMHLSNNPSDPLYYENFIKKLPNGRDVVFIVPRKIIMNMH